MTKYIDATNTHDVANVEKCFSPKAISCFGDKTCKSLVEIKNYFEQAWERIKNEQYRATNIFQFQEKQWYLVYEHFSSMA